MIILQLIFLLDYFQYVYLELFVFVCLLISSGLKAKNYLKTNILILRIIVDVVHI